MYINGFDPRLLGAFQSQGANGQSLEQALGMLPGHYSAPSWENVGEGGPTDPYLSPEWQHKFASGQYGWSENPTDGGLLQQTVTGPEGMRWDSTPYQNTSTWDNFKEGLPGVLAVLGAGYMMGGSPSALFSNADFAAAASGGAGAGGAAAATAAELEAAAAADMAAGMVPEFGSTAAYNAGLSGAGGLATLPANAVPPITPMGADIPLSSLAQTVPVTEIAPFTMPAFADAGVGGLLGGLSTGRLLGGMLGAAASASDAKESRKGTQTKMDPRLEAMLLGDGGLLTAGKAWFDQNRTNPMMQQGAQRMFEHYNSPQYSQGYQALLNQGMGLLGMPVAGNPFAPGNNQLRGMLPAPRTRI